MRTAIVWFDMGFVALSLVLAVLPALVLALRAERLRRPLTETTLWTAVLCAWWVIAVCSVRPQFLDAAPRAFGPFFALLGAPVVIGVLLMILHPTVRRRVVEIPLAWSVRLQTVRVIGAAFIVWAVAGVCSWPFALIAGLGDVAVGLSAAVTAQRIASGRPDARLWALVHALFGLTDFAVAITTAFVTDARLSWPGQLIPFFLVPLAILMHAWVLIGLWRTREARPPLPIGL